MTAERQTKATVLPAMQWKSKHPTERRKRVGICCYLKVIKLKLLKEAMFGEVWLTCDTKCQVSLSTSHPRCPDFNYIPQRDVVILDDESFLDVVTNRSRDDSQSSDE
ncbi:hypothetical protein CDAR_174561 [Caerostris darwini]|uniref:Uncharacterized protein n=1 Tax=Caerostris darwini TaxID=1538125 RepID=A0AAV4SKH1_9ARAC|nr:hypothetical protein CDAR_174561 [Caerostris darwini]